MSDSKYSDVGSNISDMVQEAIDSEDFSKLSMAIQDAVGNAVSTAVNSAVSSAVNGMAQGISGVARGMNDVAHGMNSVGDSLNRAMEQMSGRNKKDRRPDYMKHPQNHGWQAGNRGKQAQNPWKQEDGAQGISREALYSPGGASRVLGYVMFTVGLSGALGCLAGFLVLCIVGAVGGFGLIVPKAIFGVVAAACALVALLGARTISRIRRFKNYVKALGTRTCISIRELAEASGRQEKEVAKDVRGMLEDGMFVQGHIDTENRNLFVTDESYQAYRISREQMEAKKAMRRQEREREAKAQASLPEEVRKLIADGNAYIDKIRESNQAIQDPVVSAKLDGLEAVTRRIFEYVSDHPESAGETKKLMRYYLPTTIKLLDSYRRLSQEGTSGGSAARAENIQRSKKEIEDTLDTLNVAFARLFDNLYQDTSMDISADISVLHTLLAQEGLTGEEISQAMQGVRSN